MSKKKDQKRKMQLSAKSKMETFKFQVMFNKKTLLPTLPENHPVLNAELNAFCEKGLAEDMLTLRDIVEGIGKELNYRPEVEKGTFVGSPTGYLLGITAQNPFETENLTENFTQSNNIETPLQVQLHFDNEYRNEVVEWVSGHYQGVKTRLGQPILKLPNMVIEFKRVVKS